MQTSSRVPIHFDSLTIEQMQHIETRAILTHDNTMRFDALDAANGDKDAQWRVMRRVNADPSWIETTKVYL